MSNFNLIKQMNVDELASFLEENCDYDNTPWCNWWDKNYCQKCESVFVQRQWDGNLSTHECSYCEIHHHCRFFKDLNDVPSFKEIIKMWLEKE